MFFLNSFVKKHNPQYKHLSKKWTAKHRVLKRKVWDKHKDALEWVSKNLPGKEHIAAGSLTGLLLLSPPSPTPLPEPKPIEHNHDQLLPVSRKTYLLADLSTFLPKEVRPLDTREEQAIAEILSRHFGMNVRPEIEGKRLERSYGLIGAEQHLMRYPGDTLATHFQTADEAAKFARFGMAPGRGAWGYFAPSFSELTQKDIDREKYYIAVQTFLAPGFRENVREYYDFFRYRKMLVVNPQNGRAMVVVIGDAGPAVWTGKHLGGSPEVMDHLKRVDGRARGPVLYFFIDDPQDTIPLGPVEPL